MSNFLRRHKHLTGFTMASAATVLAGMHAPSLIRVPMFLFFIWQALDFVVQLCSAKTPPLWLISLLSVLAGVGFVAPAAHAIDFSILLGDTEDALKSCLLDEIAGADVVAGVIFIAIRAYIIIKVAMKVFAGLEKRNNNEKYGEEIEAVGTTFGGAIVVGIIEPLFVRSC